MSEKSNQEGETSTKSDSLYDSLVRAFSSSEKKNRRVRGGTPTPRDREMARSPQDVPLGNGRIRTASRQLGGRGRQIDDAVEKAQK